MRSRRSLRLAGMAALAAMLFVHAAFALAACGLDRPASSRAVSMLAQQAAEAPCHEQSASTSLCIAHCQSADQTRDKPQVKLPPLVFSTPMPAVRTSYALQVAFPARRPPVPLAGPPRHILFQSLLI
jgi:hypothetical protein